MKTTSESKENLVDTESGTSTSTNPPSSRRPSQASEIGEPDEYILTQIEKKFLLTAERGDCAGIRR